MHFINNNLDAPYSDQFTLGMRNRLGDWNTSAAFAYITSYDGVIASSANFFGDGTWYWYDSFFWSPFGGAPVANAGGRALFLFDNAKATRTKQILLSAEKPYSQESRWAASLAYTYSDAEERLEFNGDYQFDYAFPYYSPYARSGEVPEHRLVAIGNIDVPWGITLGAKVVVETPKPLPCICYPRCKHPASERPELQLRQGQSVSGRYDRLFYAGSAGDEDVRVRQWISHPVALRRAQRHQS